MVGQVELAVRLATAAFVTVAPTLLFLGLWRGLVVMRDDQLLEQMRAEGVLGPQPGGSGSDLADVVLPDDDGDEGVVACRACGTPNTATATFCQQCLRRLPKDEDRSLH